MFFITHLWKIISLLYYIQWTNLMYLIVSVFFLPNVLSSYTQRMNLTIRNINLHWLFFSYNFREFFVDILPRTPESALQLPRSPNKPEGPPNSIGGPKPREATLSPSDKQPAAWSCLLAYIKKTSFIYWYITLLC